MSEEKKIEDGVQDYEPRWLEKHSVNCYFCGILFDEREGSDADNFNDNDGGSICPKCLLEKEEKNNLPEEFQVIHTYTREDALNDGYFSDVTSAFCEALGKKLPQNFKVVITPDMRAAISKDAAAREISEGEALIIFLKSVACDLIDAKKPEQWTNNYDLYTSFKYHFAVESKDGEKIKVEKNYWVADENNGLNIFFPNEY